MSDSSSSRKIRKIYPLIQWGNLLLLRASLNNQQELRIVQLLIDTGSSFTVLPSDVLTEIGCNLQQPEQQVSVIAAGGMIRAPKTIVSQFNCLGCLIENFSVVALDLPARSPAAGLLGMDFLMTVGAVIDIKKGEILLS
jgi:clan AA aspartic protease (TIGR02281 family)